MLHSEPIKLHDELNVAYNSVTNQEEAENLAERWSWISHVRRKAGNNMTKQALYWTPEGRRRRERPKLVWRRSVEGELKGRLVFT